MDLLRQDLRYALRSLTRQPLFALVVAMTLALGIGMNTAIFSVLYGALFRPLPFADADRLLRVGRTRPEVPGVLLPISPSNFLDMRERVETLDHLEALASYMFMVAGATEAQRVMGARVTTGFFDLLGVPIRRGRGFLPEDGVVGAEQVVVVSDQFWRDHLGADPDAVGSTVVLSDVPRTVVGIAPAWFRLVSREDRVWAPFQWTEADLAPRQSNYLSIFGRRAPGVEPPAAVSELHAEWTRLGAEHADTFDDSGMTAVPILEAWVARSRGALYLLGGAVGLVLLVACANVANLMLARTEARQREIAVRAALGAGRGRILRQFLTEGIVLAGLGGLVGAAAAYGGVEALLAAFGSSVPRQQDVGMSGAVLAFALAVSVATGVMVGLVPAMQGNPGHAALKEGARSVGRTTRLRKGLIVAEVAVSVMLVVGTGLLLKSFWRAQQADLGFERRGLLVVDTWLPPSRYQSPEQSAGFFARMREDLLRLPRVEEVALTSMVPIRTYGTNYTRVTPRGNPDAFASFVEVRNVSPQYFDALGVPLVRGRMVTLQDTVAAAPRVVVNAHLARQLFGEGDPIGRQLDLGPQGSAGGIYPEIVGVVGDVRVFGPDRSMRPIFYYPTARASHVVIRTTGDPETLAPAVREVARAADPAVAVYRVETMEAIVEASLGDRRFQLTLLGVFAAVALALGAIGIYGVMSYTVAQRTREVGVRVALGATAANVLHLVLREGALLAAAGIGLGLAGAYAFRAAVGGLVFDVSPADPLTYGGVAVLLALVALAACFVPARRAARVEPMEALRYE